MLGVYEIEPRALAGFEGRVQIRMLFRTVSEDPLAGPLARDLPLDQLKRLKRAFSEINIPGAFHSAASQSARYVLEDPIDFRSPDPRPDVVRTPLFGNG